MMELPVYARRATAANVFLQLSKAIKWIEKADFEAKIVIAGKSLQNR